MPFDFERAGQIYTKILQDIHDGINLDIHMKDIEETIAELDLQISQQPEPVKVAQLEKLKNELYFLKLQILEKT